MTMTSVNTLLRTITLSLAASMPSLAVGRRAPTVSTALAPKNSLSCVIDGENFVATSVEATIRVQPEPDSGFVGLRSCAVKKPRKLGYPLEVVRLKIPVDVWSLVSPTLVELELDGYASFLSTERNNDAPANDFCKRYCIGEYEYDRAEYVA